MGTYVNPGNKSFTTDTGGEIYVDKTGLIEILNKSISGPNHFFAVSRPRRFGKSMAAGMIDAYYSRGCDSETLFSKYEISKSPDFRTHLNKYNVLHFDTATFLNAAKTPEDVIPMMDRRILEEMKEEFPYLIDRNPEDVPDAINLVYKHDNTQFIVIIDEYDCIIRDAKDDEKLITDYLKYLRGFFKTEESKKFLALGYITGILPIKKVDGESALNNFTEYTMIYPGELLRYFGFTYEEIEEACKKREQDPELLKKWYDGYLMNGIDTKQVHVYNPDSVVQSLLWRSQRSFWKNTGAFAGLNNYIALNMAGLKDDIIAMLAGERRPVDVSMFQNDLTHYKTKDDVLTALIHMGYLGYDPESGEAFVPNEEVREVFESAVKVGDWTEVQDALRSSDALLKATWAGDEKKVAEVISKSQQDYASIINFNDENALACAVMMSYYTARKYYYVKRELPAGRGFADIAFIPRNEGEHPAMIVELKWNRSARAAIRQIRDKEYAGALSDYSGEILLVGINYTKKTGRYSCRIEKNGGIGCHE